MNLSRLITYDGDWGLRRVIQGDVVSNSYSAAVLAVAPGSGRVRAGMGIQRNTRSWGLQGPPPRTYSLGPWTPSPVLTGSLKDSRSIDSELVETLRLTVD
ncbi:hypothetical protein [Corallococcus terminator]|uniref:Uncharacterized protein n=1 Tax=Corallococcus terminator TaxID=2316733 RepID=A0A3A8IZ45_9BACT|nr:hypothetical protein [Corallococcus terminator]RKG82573.1 hypothetical protein D7V88_25095 [Corallococcus terminator]